MARCLQMAAMVGVYLLLLLSVYTLGAYVLEARADDLTYQWDHKDPTGGSTVLFELQWSTHGGAWQSVPPVTEKQATAVTPPLAPGDKVQARVRAYIEHQGVETATSEWSDTHTYTRAPSKPTGVIVISIEVQVQ